MVNKDWDKLVAESNADHAEQERLGKLERWTKKEIPYSTLLVKGFGYAFDTVNPLHGERGTNQHHLVANYIEHRRGGGNKQQWIENLTMTGEADVAAIDSGQVFMFSPKPLFKDFDILTDVANVGDWFIKTDRKWKKAEFEKTVKIKVLSRHLNPAGTIVIRLDVRGEAAYNFKFSKIITEPDRVPIDIAIMEYALRARRPMNHVDLPEKPNCRLIMPYGVEGDDVRFSKGGRQEIREKILTAFLPLVAAEWKK